MRRRESSARMSSSKTAISINFPSPNQPWDTYPGIPDRSRAVALPIGVAAGRAAGAVSYDAED